MLSKYRNTFKKFLNATGDTYKSCTSVKKLPEKGVADFANFLLDMECPPAPQKLMQPTKNAEVGALCDGKCFVVIKEFDEHLSRAQHLAFWNVNVSMTMVILERDVESRWNSSYIAITEGDWSTSGHNPNHEKKLATAIIPKEDIQGCNHHKKNLTHPKILCHFAERHHSWYQFVRKRHPTAVELSFSDSIADSGRFVVGKVFEATGLFNASEVRLIAQNLNLPKTNSTKPTLQTN